MPDQKTINIYFGNKMNYLSKGYNVEKRMWKTHNHKNIWDNKKILHWVACKPWNDDCQHHNDIELSFKEIYHIWYKYYDMDFENDCMQ